MTGEGRDEATFAFAAYLDTLTRQATNGLIAELAPILARDELIATVELLLIAGQETAVYVIATGLKTLLSHPCLGAGLGRLEARVVLRRLAERLPGLQLTTKEGE